MLQRLFFLFILVTTSSPANAQSALEMASWCKPIVDAKQLGEDRIFLKEKTFETGKCWGAFLSLQEIITWEMPDERYPIIGVCAPPESTLSQIIHIFTHYVENNPRRAHESYVGVAISSLHDAFPCR